MANDYYTTSGYPAFNQSGASSSAREEFGLVETGFTDVEAELFLKATLASPALTGTPTAPTATADNDTTQIATTAFVLAQAGDDVVIMAGVASAGVSERYSRMDHRHPHDTDYKYIRLANSYSKKLRELNKRKKKLELRGVDTKLVDKRISLLQSCFLNKTK